MRPRIAMASAAAYGHLYPLMPLAEAFGRAGADVHVAVGPPFLGALDLPTRSSFPAEFSTMRELTHRVMAEFPAVREDPGMRWAPAFFGSVIPRLAVPELRRAWAHEPPDAVVHEALFPAAAIVAAELGVPAYSFGIGQWSPLVGVVPGLARAALDGDPRPPWDVADALGTPADVGAGYLDPFPAALQGTAPLPAPRLPIRTQAWSSPDAADEPALLARPADGRAKVFVTLGTVSFGAVETLRAAALGAAHTGAEVIVASGPGSVPEALGELPPGVSVRPLVRQDRLLATVDAIVHHGGAGTVLAAAQHAVPQLVVPQGADQFINAAAVAAAGIGLSAPREGLDADGVAGAVHRLLGDKAIHTAARSVAEDIAAMPSPDEAAQHILAAL